MNCWKAFKNLFAEKYTFFECDIFSADDDGTLSSVVNTDNERLIMKRIHRDMRTLGMIAHNFKFRAATKKEHEERADELSF